MKSTCVLHVAFLLTSIILPTAQDVIGPGHSCLRSSPANGQTLITFLREDTAGVRSLYLTLWSEDTRLVTCEVISNPLVTERYRSLCDRSDTRSQGIPQRFNISMLMAADAPCALVSSSAPKFTKRTRRDGTEGKTRRKRAWIFPGTLWCGSGSKAVGYEQLGMFESADRCCREHDHCLHNIPAFTVNYGVFNPNVFTVSHCECDQRFRQCLLGVNDTISSMVGYSFFNILRVPCFELKLVKRCTEMYWWGMCKVAKEAPYAVFKSSLPYNTSDVTHKYEDTGRNKLTGAEWQHTTESPMASTPRESSKSEQRCDFREPPRGDTFHRSRTKGRGCKTHQKLHEVAPSQVPPSVTARITVASMKSGLLNASNSIRLMSNEKRAGKSKGIRKDHVPPQATTTSDSRATSTTPSSGPPLTQRPKLQLNPTTAVAEVSTITKSPKKVPKQIHCCGSRKPVRGDTFQPHCKSCPERETAPDVTTVTPTETTTNRLPIKVTTLETRHLKKNTETPKQDTSVTLWNSTSLTEPITTELKTTVSLHEDGNPQTQVDSFLLWNNTSQTFVAHSIPAERSLKHITDNQLLCRSLKCLDECKFKILPLQKKYDLKNTESKTAYHCDCTSRLAVQIERFKQASILPSLLVDFVSQQCFTLPKKKKCHLKKSCSRGFTKASDLHQALKKIEEKETAGVRISGDARKRGIPVRLYKRCLRLERRADIMAQLR